MSTLSWPPSSPWSHSDPPARSRWPSLLRRDAPPFDGSLFMLILVIALLGLPVMYSASYALAIARSQDHLYFVRQQSISLLLGLLAMALASRLDLRRLRRGTPGLFVLSLLALLVVLIIGKGVSRWISLGRFGSFQPSEVAKVVTILMLAHVLDRYQRGRLSLPQTRLAVVLTVIPVLALVVIEPHLSATLLIAATGLVTVVIAGLPLRFFAPIVWLGLLVLALTMGATRINPRLHKKYDYMVTRLLTHVGIGEEAEEKRYQANQSRSALRRGGLTGVGFCRGKSKLLYIPAPQNDFIFSVIGEEFGLAGSLAALGLFAGLILKCWEVGYKSVDPFLSLMCAGIATLIGLQVVINVGVATAILPTTGVALPLVSYGGSGLIVLLGALGLVLNASRDSTYRTED